MKKVFALLLTFLICVSFAACSDTSEATEPAAPTVEDLYAQLVSYAAEGEYLEGWRLCQQNQTLTEYEDSQDYLAYCEAMRAYEAGGLGTAYETLSAIPELLNAQDTLDEIQNHIGKLNGYYVADNGSGSYLHIVIRDGKVASEVIGYGDEQVFAYTDEDFRNELILSNYTTGEEFIAYGRYSSIGAKVTINYVINTFADTSDIMIIKHEDYEHNTFNGMYTKVADLPEN